MPIFRYKIVNKNGYFRYGIIDANNKRDAIDKIRENGFFIQQITKDFFVIKGVSVDDLIQFFVHVSFQLKCNVSFYKSLFSYEYVSNNPRMKAITYHLIEEIRKGNSLFNAFKNEEKYFGRVIPLLLQAANSSGRLVETIDNIIRYLNMRKNIKIKVKKALFYPTIILIVSVISCLVCLNCLAPQVKEISETVFMDRVPIVTQICFGLIPDFDCDSIYIKIVIAIGLLFSFSLKRVRVICFMFLKKIPMVKNIINKMFEWYFCSIADIAFNSNLTVLQFINLICDIDNSDVDMRSSKIKQYVLSGVKLSTALEELKFLSPITLLAIKVGEESNRLDESFRYLTEEKNKQIELIVSKIGIKLGVLVTLFTSGILFFLVIGLFSPLYNYVGYINE